jgi:hypothetical protein
MVSALFSMRMLQPASVTADGSRRAAKWNFHCNTSVGMMQL